MVNLARILIFLNFIFFVANSNAQISQNDKYDYSDADYYYSIGDFKHAIRLFLKLVNKYPDNAKFNYRTGQCYLNMIGEEDNALPYLQKAVTEIDKKYSDVSTKSSGAPPKAWLYLGDALHRANQLEGASKAYHTYITYIAKNSSELHEAYKRLVGLGITNEESLHPTGYSLSNLGPVLNSKYSDYNPVLSGDQKTMAFTSFRDPRDKILISCFANGAWGEPVDITSQLGSKGDCYTTAISYDGNKLYLVNYDPFNSDIYKSKKRKGRWTRMVPLDKRINSKKLESSASFSSDGDTIYFSSDRSGGYGGFDIYYATREGDKWSKAVNLGDIINTSGDEEAPVISPGGNKLFFSSNGHETIGGMDILWSEKDKDGNWGAPVNFGIPVNTPGDDMSFWFDDDKKTGYISQISEDRDGKRDIFEVHYTEPPKPVFEEVATVQQNKSADTISSMENTDALLARDINKGAGTWAQDSILNAGSNSGTGPNNTSRGLAVAEPQKTKIPATEDIIQSDNLSKKTQPEGALKEQPNHEINSLQGVLNGNYTIQIMALMNPCDFSVFLKSIRSDIKVSEGSDGFNRYTYKRYNTYKQAIHDLNKIIRLGYKDAFIREIGGINNY